MVVHTGHRVLQSKLKQGFITEQVTTQLNWLGMVTLAVLAVDLAADTARNPFPARRRLAWALWGIMAGTLAGLCWLHPVMGGLLDHQARVVIDDDVFSRWHTVYLSLSTAQWIAGILYFGLLSLRIETPAPDRR